MALSTDTPVALAPADIAAAARIPYRSLIRWLHEGVIDADIAPPRGSRRPVLLSLEAALQVCVLAELRRAGLHRQRALELLHRMLAVVGPLSEAELLLVYPADDYRIAHLLASETDRVWAEPGSKIVLPIVVWIDELIRAAKGGEARGEPVR